MSEPMTERRLRRGRAAVHVSQVVLAVAVIAFVLLFLPLFFGSSVPGRTGLDPYGMACTSKTGSSTDLVCKPMYDWYCHASVAVADPHKSPDAQDHLCSLDELADYRASRTTYP
jgi:hypothetical protein